MLFIHILIYSKLYIIQPTKIVIGILYFVGNWYFKVLIFYLQLILLFLFFDGVVLFFTPSTIFFTNFNKILKYIYNNQHTLIQRSVKFFINFVKNTKEIQRNVREYNTPIERCNLN